MIDVVEVTTDGGETWQAATRMGDVRGAPPDNHAEQFRVLVTAPEGNQEGEPIVSRHCRRRRHRCSHRVLRYILMWTAAYALWPLVAAS